MPPGRNDTCPCGSGKKYKKCHGMTGGTGASIPDAARSPEAGRAHVLKACDMRLGDRLVRFARKHYGPYWLNDVLDDSGLLDEDGQVPDAEMPLVVPWLEHLRRDDAGLTLPDAWRRLEQPRLTPDEVLLLNAYDDAWLSVWEVTEVQRGVGSRLTDALTREERFIHDVSSSFSLQRFDAVLGIVLTLDTVSFVGGVHAQPLPPRFADMVIQAARRMCHVRTRPVAAAKLRDPEVQLDLMVLWADVVRGMLDQPPPVLSNTDGDPLVMTTDDFALLVPAETVTERLSTLDGVLEPEPEGDATVFVVTKAGNAMHRSWDNTIVGRIVVSGTRLTVETNSTRRADALRSKVEAHLEGLVRFRLRKEENSAHLMATARAGEAPVEAPPEEPLPPEALAALREFREQHLRNWIDDSIPALGGLTPRKAATIPKERKQLEILLKEMEQMETRLPADQQIDVRWMRETLGMTTTPAGGGNRRG